MAASMAAAPFRVGQKEVHLPNFTVTLLRSRHLPASQAQFLVPLWFSKLDLRDYLYHAYNVRTLAIRSYIKLSPVEQGDPQSPRPQYKRWRRPMSSKRMTVELEEPFAWPEVPESLDEWSQGEFKQAEKEQEDYGERLGPTRDTYVDKGRRERMREQAKALLEGREVWMPGNRPPVGR
ncbi:hypothetical protein MBLNU230_g2978t1 [Neophaeotheca triangularis]